MTGLTSEEVIFAIYGAGNAGKTTFRETIFALHGDYAVAADASLLVTTRKSGGATPDLARLHGRRLVTVNETDENAVLNEARVKFITGTDKITARDLYESLFDFTPSHTTFLTTNHKPIIRGTDEGIWRRIQLIAFNQPISEKDINKNFRIQKILPELPGILNWVLDGLREYHRVGLQPPPAVKNEIKQYREDMDIIGRWIEERCIRDAESKVKTSVLHADYKEWSRYEVGFEMSAIGFGRNLINERGFEPVKVNGSRGIRGLKLIDYRQQQLPV